MAKKPEIRLGCPVTYAVPKTQLTVTKRGDQELTGSVHHQSQSTFAGLVVAVSEDGGKAQIVFFPPDRAPKYVWAEPGEGDGTFQVVE